MYIQSLHLGISLPSYTSLLKKNSFCWSPCFQAVARGDAHSTALDIKATSCKEFKEKFYIRTWHKNECAVGMSKECTLHLCYDTQ